MLKTPSENTQPAPLAMGFDPYYTWLGISPDNQPPDDYRLLGIAQFEPSPDVIQNAADRLCAFLRTKATGPHSSHSQQLLSEVGAAAARLLDADAKRQVDADIRRRLDTPPQDLAAPPIAAREATAPPRVNDLADAQSNQQDKFGLATPAWLLLCGAMLLVLSGAATAWVLYAMWSATPDDRPLPAKAPFSESQARAYQVTWAAEIGQEVTVTNSVGMQLKLIPPGEFTMGSPSTERFRSEDETQFDVRITHPYYLGAFEVTQEQYESVMDAAPSQFEGRYRPVENVSWREAMKFCEALSSLSAEQAAGRTYRLPTEAEWEFACRAGAMTSLSFDANRFALADYGWFRPNAGRKTHDVGSKLPNAWGLHDMHGNVAEWCQDWYGEYPTKPIVDPLGAPTGLGRTCRGGSWKQRLSGCRSASRGRYFASEQLPSIGFRVVAQLAR